MAYHMVSNRQLVASVAAILVTVALCSWFVKTIADYMDLPEVWIDKDGKCVKVINYKNGDGYTCQDKDVILRKYDTKHVQ